MFELENMIIYCDHCMDWTMQCPKCGNNCCNAGFGRDKDGNDCEFCPHIYNQVDLIASLTMYRSIEEMATNEEEWQRKIAKFRKTAIDQRAKAGIPSEANWHLNRPNPEQTETLSFDS